MKLLVCGGRNFEDKEWLYRFLDIIHKEDPIDTIIHGDARGADRLAGQWAIDNGITELKFPADWEKNGKAAGPIRNFEMLTKSCPDLVIAFPGGKGTKNMIDLATKKGYEVFVS